MSLNLPFIFPLLYSSAWIPEQIRRGQPEDLRVRVAAYEDVRDWLRETPGDLKRLNTSRVSMRREGSWQNGDTFEKLGMRTGWKFCHGYRRRGSCGFTRAGLSVSRATQKLADSEEEDRLIGSRSSPHCCLQGGYLSALVAMVTFVTMWHLS